MRRIKLEEENSTMSHHQMSAGIEADTYIIYTTYVYMHIHFNISLLIYVQFLIYAFYDALKLLYLFLLFLLFLEI